MEGKKKINKEKRRKARNWLFWNTWTYWNNKKFVEYMVNNTRTSYIRTLKGMLSRERVIALVDEQRLTRVRNINKIPLELLYSYRHNYNSFQIVTSIISPSLPPLSLYRQHVNVSRIFLSVTSHVTKEREKSAFELSTPSRAVWQWTSLLYL